MDFIFEKHHSYAPWGRRSGNLYVLGTGSAFLLLAVSVYGLTKTETDQYVIARTNAVEESPCVRT